MPGPCPRGRSDTSKTATATRALAVFLVAATVWSAGACGAPASAPGASSPEATGHRPRVVATTTIIGDVVASIGGDRIELAVLLPIGVDPHGFTPTSREVATVADADVLFLNGLGLEAAMRAVTENVGTSTQVITLSDGIDRVVLSRVWGIPLFLLVMYLMFVFTVNGFAAKDLRPKLAALLGLA